MLIRHILREIDNEVENHSVKHINSNIDNFPQFDDDMRVIS